MNPAAQIGESGPIPGSAAQAGATARPLAVCLVYATFGRAEILSRTFDAVANQTVQPTSVIVSCANAADAGTLAGRGDVTVVTGPRGASRQRNRALQVLPPGTDVVVFFDDDFVPHPRWLEAVAGAFAAHPDIGAVTGNLLADGINGPGLSLDEAFARVARGTTADTGWIEEPYSPYGCNMAFRCSMIAGLAFDERLVLYGWLEDRDFGAALRRRSARIVKLGAALGVHMGVKRGRVAGIKLGYSQVVNPIYLNRKGTMAAGAVVDHIARNTISNLVKALRPEPYVDRAGRLRGNLRGVLDVLRGRVTPERAELL